MLIYKTFYLNKIRLKQTIKTASKTELRKRQSFITPDYHFENCDGSEV